MRKTKNPTTVMTANGEVLAKEEATENVRELDFLVTVMLLEDTPAVLSLGKQAAPVLTRKTDRFHNLRQFSSDWRS